MNKSTLYVVVALVVVLGLGYVGRHKIKSMLGMNPPAPVVQTTDTSASPSAASGSDNIYMTKTDTAKGKYMTDFAGMTLYTYDKDTAGVSTCIGTCAKAWPPYSSGATAQGTLPANISVITRTDGSKQFAWKGMPLYYFASDSKAGDLSGDGVGSVWHIVKL